MGLLTLGSLAQLRVCFLRPARLVQRDRQIDARHCEAGLDLQRHAVRISGFLEPSKLLERGTEVAVRFCVAGGEANG